jgi:hypothetical protein
MYLAVGSLTSVAPERYPGVSMKHKLRSRTVSSMLFLRRSTLLSSASDHQAGYDFVLANSSVICVVPLSLGRLDLALVFDEGGLDTTGAVLVGGSM